MGVEMQRAIDQLIGFGRAILAHVKAGQFDQGFDVDFVGLDGAFEKAHGQLVAREGETVAAGFQERFRFPSFGADGFVEAMFGFGVVVSRSVTAAEVEEQEGFGRGKADCTFEEIDGGLVIAAAPGDFGIFDHPGDGILAMHNGSTHVGIKIAVIEVGGRRK